MIMKLKMEILIWKLVHRALLLAVGGDSRFRNKLPWSEGAVSGRRVVKSD